MSTFDEVKKTVVAVLQLKGDAADLNPKSHLLGAIPELDSMSVVTILTMLEDSYGFCIEDDEVDGDVFETLESLTAFIDRKLSA